MNLKALKAWYMQTFLPYEDEGHPLYAATPKEEDLSDWDELGPYKQQDHKG